MRDRKRLILLRSSVPMTFSYTTETTLSNFYASLKYSKYRGHTQRKWLWKKRKKNRKRLLSSDEKLFNLFCFTVLSVFNEVKVSLVYHCVTYKSMYGRTTNSSHQAISRRSSYFQQTALHVLQVAGTKYVAEIKVPKPNWVFATLLPQSITCYLTAYYVEKNHFSELSISWFTPSLRSGRPGRE